VSDLHQLLEVQAHDTLADQLAHRKANLPERAELAAIQARRQAVVETIATRTTERSQLGVAQDRLEVDIATARDRVKAVESTLYGGSVSNPRELQALQDEIASLNRRVGLLEDEELAIMEQLEPVDAALAEATDEEVRLGAEVERLGMAVTIAEAELEQQLEANLVTRTEQAAQVPGPLLAEYESIRAQSGGIAVAALTAGQCGGCHMRLSSMELDRVKKQPADAIVHCEECGRLLVR